MSLSYKLTKGDQVTFQTKLGKPLFLYFEKSLNDKQGFFQDEQRGGPYRKNYSNIIRINGKPLKLNELGIIHPMDNHDVKPSKDFEGYENIFDFSFEEDDKTVKVILSLNPIVSLESLDKIFGTKYYSDYNHFFTKEENYIEDKKGSTSLDNNKFIKSLPRNIQRCGEISFTVDGNTDSVKLRNNTKKQDEEKLKRFEEENKDLIQYVTQRGYEGLNKMQLYLREKPQLYHFINKDNQKSRKLNDWENLKRQNKNNIPEEEKPDIKTYLKILSKVAGISLKFVLKYKPNIMIFNHNSGDLPEEISQKRNQVYKQFISKNLIPGYQVKEKSGVLYIEKKGLNEIKINNPTIKKWDFDKYIPNFDPKYIKSGDEIYLTLINQTKKTKIKVINVTDRCLNTESSLPISFSILNHWNDENKPLQEIKVNNPTKLTVGKKYNILDTYTGKYNIGYVYLKALEPHEYEDGFIPTKLKFMKDNHVVLVKPEDVGKRVKHYNNIKEMTQQQIIKEELENIINQNKQDVLTFESNPIEYILKKYPSLNEVLIELLTSKFRDYITGLFVLAPKPTVFKVLLHNGQYFYLTYTTKNYIAKVSGKQYFLMNLKDQEYAIKAISNLLMMGMPPSAEGPGEETTPQDGVDNSFVADMTSEPGGDLGLDGVDSSPEANPDEEQPEEEPIKETKEKKYRIIK